MDEGRFDPLFVYYYARLLRDELKSRAAGAATPILNKSAFSQIEIRAPDLSLQRRIASILSAYDDLIEVNRRRIALLEKMAGRLFEEWFVRSGGQHSDTSGWEAVTVGHLGQVVTGKTPSKAKPEFFEGRIPFIKIPDMQGAAFILATEDHLSAAGANSQSNKTVPRNALCVSCIGTIGLVAITTEPSQTNQQINSLILAHDYMREFAFFTLKRARATLQNLGSTGATMGNVNKTKFERVEVLLPPETSLVRYHEIAAPLFDGILNYSTTIRTLSRSRDFLLPRLVSGDIAVAVAERELEAVA